MATNFCADCKEKEMEAQKRIEETADQRVADMNAEHARRVLLEKVKVDEQIEVSQDVFNAKTLSIVEIEKAVNADDTIPQDQKFYATGEQLVERFTHLKKVLFETTRDIQSEMKAIQVRLNTLAVDLKEEEREKLKLQHINYQPEKPKKIKVAKPKAEKKKKFAKKELLEWSKFAGIDIASLQMMCHKKNMTPEQAAKFWKENM